MKQELKDFLKELKEHGIKNDIPNVTETGGKFLNMLVSIRNPKSILEIGCANGYSTIWMAEAAERVGGMIYAIDHSRPSMAEAKENIANAGFDEVVDFVFDDAIKALSKFPEDLKFDFVFVDGEKKKYLDFWNAIQSRLSTEAVVVFDDVIKFPEKTKEFMKVMEGDNDYDKTVLPLDEDDGILLVIKK